MTRVMGFEELRLRIKPQGRAGSYLVYASTPAAEASAPFELPFNDLEIENFNLKVSRPRGRRRVDTSAMGDARDFGGRLFKAVFRDQIHTLYHTTVAEARSRDWGVRVTLCLTESPELNSVPWEFLFDHPDFLAVSAFTPVVRYLGLELPRAHRPLSVKPPLRLVGVVSSPRGREALDVERERSNLDEALAGLREAGAVDLHWLKEPTPQALLRELQTQEFHGLHFIGHGAYDPNRECGTLAFEDEHGWERQVTGDELGMILRDFDSLRLAVLNACESARGAPDDLFRGVAGSLVQRGIPAVIAMQFEISDEAAIAFAKAFYERLAAGLPVDASLAAARLAMLAERGEDIEWGTPVLYMRVANGQIFDVGDQPESASSHESRAIEGRQADGPGLPTIEQPGLRVLEPEPSRAGDYAARGASPSADRESDQAKHEVRPPSEAHDLRERLIAERAGSAHLIYRDADGHQMVRILSPIGPLVTIGRLNQRDVSLDWDGEVSRLHATIELTEDDWTIVDGGSRNGSFVNGDRIVGPRRLRDGDKILVGQTTIVFRSPRRAEGDTTRPGAASRESHELSDVDRRVLVALCRPLRGPGQALPATDNGIADELSLTVAKVKKRLSALFELFGLDQLPDSEKRSRLAIAALQNGLVSAQDFGVE